MAHRTLEADKMLDIYIYDYLLKRKHYDSAKIFLREAGVPASPTAIDTPGGFLFEWWSVFWDVFISRYKRLGPTKEESHGLLEQPHYQQQWLDQTQMLVDHQNHLKQQQLKWQRNDIQLRPSVKRKLEESRSWAVQKDAFADGGKRPKCNEKAVMVPDLSRDSHLGQLMHDVPASNTKIDQNQLFLTYPGLLDPMTILKATSSDGSFCRANVTGLPVHDFPLEGWPLKGGSRVLQPQLLKGNQFVQLHAQSIGPCKLSGHPICQPQSSDQAGGSGSVTNYDGGSCTSLDSYQARICQIVGEGNQPSSFVDPANSSGTDKEVGLTSSAVDIKPLTQATDDTLILLASSLDDSSFNAHVSRTAAVGPHSSEPDQVAALDKFVNNDSGVDNTESLMHSCNSEGDKITAACLDATKDITFTEVGAIPADLVNLCDFSLDGKLIASAANDQKVVLWCADSKERKFVLDEHSDKITDIRFGPRLSRIATSSYDRTVKIWTANNPGKSLRTLKGHSAPVVSLDFHPKKDLVCSCDSISAIRYWNVQSGGCTGVSRGGANQVRFQPSQGKYLAAAVQNVVSMIDVETAQSCRLPLKGHRTNVLSVCWDSSGEHLVSSSKDLIRVWKFGRGEEKNCIHELSISGKTFSCCVLHPRSRSLLVIGFSESLELWDMAENKLVTMLKQPVTALAVSQLAGLVASAGDDGVIKVWK